VLSAILYEQRSAQSQHLLCRRAREERQGEFQKDLLDESRMMGRISLRVDRRLLVQRE